MNKNKTLLKEFVEFNLAGRLAGPKKKTLLAVSGGVDSVVMCDLFYRAGFPFGIAHVNFRLRGVESDEDESFIRALGQKYSAPVFVHAFDTKQYADENKLSIQVAARILRYQWFEEIRVAKDYLLVATAHQLNDQIETVFYNMIKGAGVHGLRGIPVRQGSVIRPMLFASRERIEKYAAEEQLSFREDSSNADDKYTRNKIRHHLIPLMKEINPSLEETFAAKTALYAELEELYDRSVRKSAAQLFQSRKGDVYIPIRKLVKTKNASTVLFEYLKNYGFNAAQVEDILANTDDIPGKQFLSNQTRIIKDRRFFILTPLPEKDITIKLIQENDSEVILGKRKMSIDYSDVTTGLKEVKITKDVHTAFIDRDKIAFPLTVRHWKDGDYFYPFGMKMKKKKLKKFFSDEKVPLHEKENVWVLESDKKIVWVAGYRLDERFKITERTKRLMKIRWH